MAWTTAFRRPLRLAGLLTMCATGIATCVHAQESDVQRGFAIAPVPVEVAGKNPALVGRGSYLVNAIGNCNDCHTHPS